VGIPAQVEGRRRRVVVGDVVVDGRGPGQERAREMQPRDAEIAHRRIPLDVFPSGALAAPRVAIIRAIVGGQAKKMWCARLSEIRRLMAAAGRGTEKRDRTRKRDIANDLGAKTGANGLCSDVTGPGSRYGPGGARIPVAYQPDAPARVRSPAERTDA